MHIAKKEIDDSDAENETNSEIVEKVGSGIYHVVRNKNQKTRSHVWNIFHRITQEDGTEIQSRLYCIRCSRVLTSRGMATSNLRRHKCFLKYLQEIGVSDSYRDEDEDNDNSITAKSEATHVDDTMTGDNLVAAAFRNMETHTAAKRRHCEDNELSQSSYTLQTDSANALKCDPRISSAASSSSLCLEPSTTTTTATSVNAVSTTDDEAEIFAKAWAQAYRKLSETQKFYAKRGIDELLVLGRLERLTLNTVTVLSSNK